MMQLKTVPVIGVMLMAFALAVVAQESAPPAAPQAQGRGYGKGWKAGAGRGADPVARRLQMMERRFNLTEQQKAQLKPILENSFQQAQSIRNDTSLSPEQKKAKIQELRQATHTQVQSLLTPEQQAQAKQAASPENRVEFLSRKLNLTEDQKTRLTPIFEQQQQQMQSLKQDTSLSPEQKRDKARQIRQDTHNQVLAVLTPEQQQQLRSNIRSRYGRHGRGFRPGAGPQGGAGDRGMGQGTGPGM